MIRSFADLDAFLHRSVSGAPSYRFKLSRLHEAWTEALDEGIPSLLKTRDEIAGNVLRNRHGNEAKLVFLQMRREALRECLEEPALSDALRNSIAAALTASVEHPEAVLETVNACLLSAKTEILIAEFHEERLRFLVGVTLQLTFVLERLLDAARRERSGKGADWDDLELRIKDAKAGITNYDPLDESATDAFKRVLESVAVLDRCAHELSVLAKQV
jgi:hypothetical protein